jgi:hypothetical protein
MLADEQNKKIKSASLDILYFVILNLCNFTYSLSYRLSVMGGLLKLNATSW